MPYLLIDPEVLERAVAKLSLQHAELLGDSDSLVWVHAYEVMAQNLRDRQVKTQIAAAGLDQ